jgi:succinate-acetate transporter protein
MTTSHEAPTTEGRLSGQRVATRERTYAFDANRADAGGEGWPADDWRERSRIVLTPVAAPSILGLFGFFSATLLIGANLAGWWGSPLSQTLVFPLALVLGGLAQFLAGMWAYRARDGLATAMHGIWGGFWLAFGLYQLLVTTGNLPAVTMPQDVAFGFWFIPLGAITTLGAFAALARNAGMFAVLAPLAAGSGFAAAGFIGGLQWALVVSGWLFVFSAGFALYAAGAMMLREAYGRTILPTGEWKAAANVPGRRPGEPVEYEAGMPGSRAGQ